MIAISYNSHKNSKNEYDFRNVNLLSNFEILLSCVHEQEQDDSSDICSDSDLTQLFCEIHESTSFLFNCFSDNSDKSVRQDNNSDEFFTQSSLCVKFVFLTVYRSVYFVE